MAAARRQGIFVCATGYQPYPAAEHTWALILAAARQLATELPAMREFVTILRAWDRKALTDEAEIDKAA